MIVIHHMVHISLPKDPHLNKLIDQTKIFLEGFELVRYFHTLYNHNHLVDAMKTKPIYILA